MSGKGFRYALEPLRLSRSWDVDALMAVLAGHNERVATQRGALETLCGQLSQVRSDWLAGQAAGQPLALERMAMLSRYLHDGAVRQATMTQRLETLEAEREAVVQQLAAARRALDAVEEHRDGERRAFWRERASADLKTADEHWNVLHGRETEHDIDG